MKCAEVVEQFPLYSYGEVSSEVEERVESHLAECANCQTAFARHRAFLESLDQREERLLLPGAEPREELVVVALRTHAAAKRGERHRCSQADPQAGRSQGS